MKNIEITKQQQKLLDYLRTAPDATIGDIMAKFRFKSRNAVHWHVRKLESAGILRRPKVERSGWEVAV